MRLLELFSGTKSVGRAFEALGWEVTSLDADATTRPGICADIREWDYRTYPPGHFDFIWASPVCTEFSRALTRRPRRLELEDGDCLVLKTIEIIGYLRPRWWAVENPRTGLLKSRPYMKALPYDDVSYCMYGFRYQKTTRIWNNLPWVPSQPRRNHGGAGALRDCGRAGHSHRGGAGVRHAEQRPELERRADLQPAPGQQRPAEPVGASAGKNAASASQTSKASKAVSPVFDPALDEGITTCRDVHSTLAAGAASAVAASALEAVGPAASAPPRMDCRQIVSHLWLCRPSLQNEQHSRYPFPEPLGHPPVEQGPDTRRGITPSLVSALCKEPQRLTCATPPELRHAEQQCL